MGEIDTEALQRLNKLIQDTMMSDFGIDGDKSASGVNKAINYVIQHSTKEWSGGIPGDLKAFFTRNKVHLGKVLSAAVDLGITADMALQKSKADAAAGIGTQLNKAQALKVAQAQM